MSVFAVIGRISHGESAGPLGIWHTAWPFLTGTAVGTIAARAWRRPGSLAAGVVIWACTVAGGMVLRVLSGNTIAVSFVVVAAISLAVPLLGWRAICRRSLMPGRGAHRVGAGA